MDLENKEVKQKSRAFDTRGMFMTLLVIGVLAAVVSFNFSGADKVAGIIGIPELKHALAVLAVASGVVLFFVRSNSIMGVLLKLFAHSISYAFLVVAIYSGMIDNKIDSVSSSNSADNSTVKIASLERLIENNLTKDERALVDSDISAMKLKKAFNSKGVSTGKTIYELTNGCSHADGDSKNYQDFCKELSELEASLLLFSDKTRIELQGEVASLRESSSVQQSSSEKTDKFGTILASNGVKDEDKAKALTVTALIIGGILEVFIFMVITYWQQEKESVDHENTANPPSSTVQQTSGKRPPNKNEKKSGVLGKVARAAAEYQVAREEAKKSQKEIQKDRDMSLNVARAIMAVDGAALIGVISAKFLPNAEKHRTDKMRVCVCAAACLWEFVDEKTNEFKLQNGDGYISQNEFVDKIVDRHKKTMITKNDRGGEDRYMTYGMFKNWIVPIMVDDLKVWRREESTGKIFQRRETEVMVFLSNAMKRKGALKSVA